MVKEKTEEIKCKNCGSKRFLGKYANRPYCIDCGCFLEKEELKK